MPYLFFVVGAGLLTCLFKTAQPCLNSQPRYKKLAQDIEMGGKIKEEDEITSIFSDDLDISLDVRDEDISGWVNEVLFEQWRFISRAALQSTLNFITPIFESNTPKFLKYMKVQKLDLGNVPPIIKKISTMKPKPSSDGSKETVTTAAGQNSIILVDVQWTVNDFLLDIETAPAYDIGGIVGNVLVQVRDLKFAGTLRLELCDMHENWPTFNAVEWAFAIRPRFKFDIRVVSQYFEAGVTPLRNFIKDLLTQNLVKNLVWPNCRRWQFGGGEEEEEKLLCAACSGKLEPEPARVVGGDSRPPPPPLARRKTVPARTQPRRKNAVSLT